MREVVIVEDDRSTNDRLAKLVREFESTNVTQACTREEGERLIASQKFQLAIVDVDLGPEPLKSFGKYGGFSLLAKLASDGVPTIVVSGILEENLPGMALALQAYDFISKPITDADFINKVRHGLEWRSGGGVGTNSAGVDTAWPDHLRPDPAHNPGLLWKGKAVRLTMTEHRLVNRLIKTPGLSVDKATLANEMGTATSDTALATHISGVRRKFKDADSQFNAIGSEPGKGYVWRKP